jgi:hypothetical protein
MKLLQQVADGLGLVAALAEAQRSHGGDPMPVIRPYNPNGGHLALSVMGGHGSWQHRNQATSKSSTSGSQAPKSAPVAIQRKPNAVAIRMGAPSGVGAGSQRPWASTSEVRLS